MDGGVRTGTDVFKALALGAKAVFVGRPSVYGLAYDVRPVYTDGRTEYSTVTHSSLARKQSDRSKSCLNVSTKDKSFWSLLESFVLTKSCHGYRVTVPQYKVGVVDGARPITFGTPTAGLGLLAVSNVAGWLSVSVSVINARCLMHYP